MISELQVGVITQTHGIRGEVKVFPTTDDVNRFRKLKEVILETEIEGVKFFKQYVILKFKNYDSINDMEKYKKARLLVPRDKAVKLKKDEYFVADLIGMKVVTEDGTPFGILKNVLETGANDVYVVEKLTWRKPLSRFILWTDCWRSSATRMGETCGKFSCIDAFSRDGYVGTAYQYFGQSGGKTVYIHRSG